MRQHWTFGGDFNPAMEIKTLVENHELLWRCVVAHDPWVSSSFRFQLVEGDGVHTRLRFTQDYAAELDDDSYGTYYFNWGYYFESLRLFCTTGTARRCGSHPG